MYLVNKYCSKNTHETMSGALATILSDQKQWKIAACNEEPQKTDRLIQSPELLIAFLLRLSEFQ